MNDRQKTDSAHNSERAENRIWFKFGLLLALPAAGLSYWLSLPNAVGDIRTELKEISSGLIISQNEFEDEDDELPLLGSNQEKVDWESLASWVDDDEENGGDENGGSFGSSPLSVSDAENFARSLRIPVSYTHLTLPTKA